MSISKNEIKLIKSLSTKKGRKSDQRFTAEGVRLLEESVKFNLIAEKVYYCEHMLNDRGKTLLGRLKKKSETVNLIPRPVH